MTLIGDDRSNIILQYYQSTGISAATAHAEKQQPGLTGSLNLAANDAGRIMTIKHRFEMAGDSTDLPPALLAGIVSRETHCGLLLDKNGWGDNGNAYGICQIDKRSHKIYTIDGPDGLAHIDQAGLILDEMRKRVGRMHPDWSRVNILRGAVAAYNVGAKNVQTIDGMDIGTTHDDYSADVWARARYYAGYY